MEASSLHTLANVGPRRSTSFCKACTVEENLADVAIFTFLNDLEVLIERASERGHKDGLLDTVKKDVADDIK